VVVGSFDFPESDLLAQLYGQAFSAAGFAVVYARDVGPREVVEPALWQGMIGFVPEYSGSALAYLDRDAQATSDANATMARLRTALGTHGLVPLAPAPAQDQNAVAVTRATAATYGLETISDLAKVAPQFRFGGLPECPRRPLCLEGLSTTYGLSFGQFAPLPGTDVVATALQLGGIDAGTVFSTDGVLLGAGLVVLEDDRGLQPADNVVPVVRSDLLAALGARAADLTAVADRISARLTTAELQSLNLQVSRGRSTTDAAAEWLRASGLTT
jgi:osmoprotectant transport system substrate-binding protein